MESGNHRTIKQDLRPGSPRQHETRGNSTREAGKQEGLGTRALRKRGLGYRMTGARLPGNKENRLEDKKHVEKKGLALANPQKEKAIW